MHGGVTTVKMERKCLGEEGRVGGVLVGGLRRTSPHLRRSGCGVPGSVGGLLGAIFLSLRELKCNCLCPSVCPHPQAVCGGQSGDPRTEHVPGDRVPEGQPGGVQGIPVHSHGLSQVGPTAHRAVPGGPSATGVQSSLLAHTGPAHLPLREEGGF